MISGDNILTAISVGKDCGIIGPSQGVITVNATNDHAKTPQLYYTLAPGTRNRTDVRYHFICSLNYSFL